MRIRTRLFPAPVVAPAAAPYRRAVAWLRDPRDLPALTLRWVEATPVTGRLSAVPPWALRKRAA